MGTKPTLPEKFFEQAAKHLDAKAFSYCRVRDHKWVTMTWKRYREEVGLIAQWLQAQGIGKGTKVGILAANRPEWIITDLAILSVGAISVPIFATASPSDVSYILEHSETEVLFVDRLDRIRFLEPWPLKSIVSFDRASKKQTDAFRSKVTLLSGLLHQRKSTFDRPVALDDNDRATIIYTSGTTGKPKGVVHTHGNIAEAMAATQSILVHPEGKPDRFFSFLPLSHVAERVLVEIGSIQTGSEVAFARSIETLSEDLLRYRPTILLCVPRLWEKIYEKIQASLLTASPLKRLVFEAAQSLGEQRIDGDRIVRSRDRSVTAFISDVLVGKALRERLGLDRARMLVTGAAPTRPDLMRFFGSFGMMIREVYGLTENLCLGVLNDAEQVVIGSCGSPFPGNEMRLAADGEVLFRAPWMFKEYYKNPEATREVIDPEGWFSTGDLGQLDANGRLRIVGRKKELLKTSGGKYIAPVPIEDSLKTLPLLKEAVVLGDSRKYCVALITLDEEQSSKLTPEELREEIKQHLLQVNEPLASYETIKRVGVIKGGFSVENGCLTPTLKLKRNAVTQSKMDFIETLYRSEDAVIFEA